MPAERFFVDAPLLKGDAVSLVGQEFVHLVKVMRASEGEAVELVNGRGVLAAAELQSIGKKEAKLLVLSHETAAPPPEAVIAQALPMLNRLEFIVEKGTELGMTALWLFPGEWSERKGLTEQQTKRLVAIAIAAMKQCGRLYLPEISLVPPLKNWEKLQTPFFYGDLSNGAPPFAKRLPKGDFLFCVGPERGFSDREKEILRSLGGEGVRLHGNILRTDTASLVALSIAGGNRC